jgi:putative alpha-1,2-mannosidase
MMAPHDHDDPDRLTIGCRACVAKVRHDQAVALLDDEADPDFEDALHLEASVVWVAV